MNSSKKDLEKRGMAGPEEIQQYQGCTESELEELLQNSDPQVRTGQLRICILMSIRQRIPCFCN